MKEPYRKALPLAAAWTVNSLAYSIIYPFLPIYLNRVRGYPMDQAGLIYPVMGFAVMAAPLFAGLLVDRLGRVPVMRYGQSVRAAVFLLLGGMVYLNAPLWLFIAVLGLNSAVGMLFQVGADAYLSDITTAGNRPAAYSLIRIGTNIGWAIGPALGAFFSAVPFWLMFCLTALLCLAGDQYTGYACREQHLKPQPQSGGEHFSVRRLIGDRGMNGVLTASLSLYFLTSQLYTLLPVYATGRVGISTAAMGYIFSLNGMVIICCQIPVVKVLDKLRISLRYRLILGCFLYVMGYFSFAFAAGVWMIASGMIILTLGETVIQPSIYSAVIHLAPADGVGRYLSALGLVRGIGYTAGPYFGSLAYKYITGSPVVLWGAMCGFGIFALAIYALMVNRRVMEDELAAK